MTVANVATITMADGTVVAYAAHDGHLHKTTVNLAAGQQTSSKIEIAKNGPATGCSVIAAVGLDPTVPYQRHVFYRIASKNFVYHFVDDPTTDGTDTTVVSTQLVLDDSTVIACPGTFGTVVTSYGIILLGISNNSSQQPATIWVLSLPWASLSPTSFMFGATCQSLDLSSMVLPGSSFNRGDCDLSAVLANDQTSNTPTIVFVVKLRSSQGYTLYCFSAPIPDLNIEEISLRGTSPLFKSISFPKLTLRPDYIVQLTYFDNNKLLHMCGLSFNTVLTLNNGTIAWPDIGDITILNQLNKKPTSFDLAFYDGAAQSQSSQANSSLTDTKLPLYPAILYWNNSLIISSADSNIWVYLCRTGQPSVPAQKALLMGVIEGPPPIPDENVNMSSSYDPYNPWGYPAMATTQFAISQSTTDTFSWSVKSGLLIKAGVSVEVGQNFLIWEAEAEINFELQLEIAYRQQVMTSEMTWVEQTSTTKAEFSTDPDTQQIVVAPAGSLILMSANWTGYLYEVQAPDGTVLEDPPTFVSIFPTNINITQEPYTLNPASAPTPGDLASYQLQPDEIQALNEQSAYLFSDNADYMSATWAYNGTLTPVYGTTQTVTHTDTLNVDLQALLGMEGAASLLGVSVEATFSSAVKVGLEFVWSTATSEGIRIAVDVGLRGNPKAPNSYTKYSYDTYFLEESNSWTSDLLSQLVTDNFPSDPNLRQQNQLLQNMIHPDSTPWKICYSVDMTQARFNPPAADALAPDAALTQKYGAAFKAANLTTTHDLAQLIDGVTAIKSGDDPALHATTVATLTHSTAPAISPLLTQLVDSPTDYERLSDLVRAAQQRQPPEEMLAPFAPARSYDTIT